MRRKEERYRFLCFGGGSAGAACLVGAFEEAGRGMMVVGRDKASATMEVVASLGCHRFGARRNGNCSPAAPAFSSAVLPYLPTPPLPSLPSLSLSLSLSLSSLLNPPFPSLLPSPSLLHMPRQLILRNHPI